MTPVQGALRSLVVAFSVSPLLAFAQAQPDPTTTLKIGTQLRVLDVTVLDSRGRPVTSGLTKDDFKIDDGKHMRPVLSFEVNDVAAPGVAPPRTVIIVDHLNSTNDQQAWEQKNVRKYLSEQAEELPHETEIAVLQQDGIHIVQPFTRDRLALTNATDKLNPIVAFRLTGSWASDNFQVTTQSLDELALQVKGYPGRKNLVFIGTGGPGISLQSLNAHLEDQIRAYVRRAADNLVDARISLFVISPDIQVGDVRYPGGKAPSPTIGQSSGGEALPIAQDVTAGGIPQSGTDALIAATSGGSDPFSDHVNLSLIAHLSGGTFFANRNDISNEVQESIALGTKYYTISYKPEPGEKEGKFVPVTVSFDKPGLHALTKKGYYTINDETTRMTAEQQGQYDIRRAGTAGVQFNAIHFLAQPVRRDPAQETVTFKLLLRPADLTFQPSGSGPLVGNIAVGAMSVGGTHDMLASNAAVMAVQASNVAGSQSTQPKLPVEITVKVPKKTNHVRLVVRDAVTGKLGSFDLDKAAAEATPVAAAGGAPTPGKS